MSEKINKSDFVTSTGERFTYGMYFCGQLIFYIIVLNFLSLFLTDSGVPAMAVSAIFLAVKIWDAVNDPIFGVIVDKAKPKGGKYVPWVRISSFLIPIATIFMFLMPSSISLQGKIVWAVAAYVLWDTSYTICDVPIFALATAMTDKLHERDSLLLMNRLFALVGSVIALVTVPLMYPHIGWPATVIILAVFGMSTMLPVGYKAKERFFTREESEESPALGQLVKYLLKNKYLLIFNGALIVCALTNTSAVVGNYVAIYCLGGPQWITIVSLASTLPALLSVPLTNRLIKKVDKMQVFLGAIAVTILLNIVQYFAGYGNIPVYLGLVFVKSLFFGSCAILQIVFTADCAEYGHFITGERAQGVAFSVQTFTAKLTAALSGAVGMFALGLAGFIEGEGVVQTQSTIGWLWKLNTLVPTISLTAALLILLFGYKLKTKDVLVMMSANKGEITKEEAMKIIT